MDTVSRDHWVGTDKLNILFVPINAPSFDNSLITKNACLKNVIFQKYVGRPLLGAWGIKTKSLLYTFLNIYFLLKNCIHNMIHGKGKVPYFLNILHCKKASIFAGHCWSFSAPFWWQFRNIHKWIWLKNVTAYIFNKKTCKFLHTGHL